MASTYICIDCSIDKT